MNKFMTGLAGASVAFFGATAQAATIDTTGFDLVQIENISTVSDGYIDLLTIGFGTDLVITGFLPASSTSLAVDYTGFSGLIVGFDEVAVSASILELLFTNMGSQYLITADMTGGFGDFTDASGFADFFEPTTVTLDLLVAVNTNVVPLPAGMVLLLTGLGGLAVARRKKA